MHGTGVGKPMYKEEKNPLTGKGKRHSKSAATAAVLGISKAQIPPPLTKSEEESIIKSVGNMRKTILEEYNFPNKEPFISLKEKLANDTVVEDGLEHIAQLLDAYLPIAFEQKKIEEENKEFFRKLDEEKRNDK